MTKDKKYRLYVGETQEIPDGIRFSFYNHRNKYILLYSNVKPKSGDFILVSEKIEEELAADERRWLTDCKMRINADYMQEHAEEYKQFLSEFADALDDVLNAESAKARKQTIKEGDMLHGKSEERGGDNAE